MTLSRNGCRGVLLLSLVGATGAGSSALAHSLHVMYGEMVVHPERVVLTIETDAASLAHWRGASEARLGGDALRDAVYAQSDMLAGGVVLRDATGKRLSVGRVRLPLDTLASDSAAETPLSYSIEFLGNPAGSLLVLQYVPQVTLLHQEQITLVVQGAGDDQQELVQLTSGGNVEYLEVQLATKPAPGGADDAKSAKSHQRVRVATTNRFSLPSVTLSTDSSPLEATVSMPLNMLKLWITQSTEKPDFLSTGERAACATQVRDLFERALVIESGETTTAPELAALTYITANGSPAGTEPLSIWTSQLQARLRWSEAPVVEAKLTWRLFNPGLLAIDVEAAGGKVKRRLTSYAPHVPVRDVVKP